VGYTTEYPIEQSMRDSKILTIWEGTTFIYGNDLVGRKMRMEGGASFTSWMSTIKNFIDAKEDIPGFAAEMGRLRKAYDCLGEIRALYDTWYENMDEKKQFIPLNAVRAMTVCGQLQVAECLLEQAVIAAGKLAALPADHVDRSFYEGTVASARYYANQILPATFVLTEMIKGEDLPDCPEDALVVK
ncbi:MAG: acyl-CoA dehydrogenase, partial [Desulfatirhabdiaceae bacterium]